MAKGVKSDWPEMPPEWYAKQGKALFGWLLNTPLAERQKTPHLPCAFKEDKKETRK